MSRTCDFAANWARFDAEKIPGYSWEPIREQTPEEKACIAAYNAARDNPLREPLPEGWHWDKDARGYIWTDGDLIITTFRTSNGPFRVRWKSSRGVQGSGGYDGCDDATFLRILAEQPAFVRSLWSNYYGQTYTPPNDAGACAAEKTGGTE